MKSFYTLITILLTFTLFVAACAEKTLDAGVAKAEDSCTARKLTFGMSAGTRSRAVCYSV